LDVRDYAEGALRAAERGSPGKRYILSGSNVTPEQLLQEVAQVAGVKPARWLIHLHLWIVYPIVAAMALWRRLGGNPPKISRSLLKLWGQYAWYDTSRARAELGWEPRPLRETLNDTINWFRENQSR
jgi:dihydroflavonol-4-reductase